MPSDSHDPMHQPLAAQPATELWTSPFEALLKQELPTLHQSNGSAEIQQPDPIIGTPARDSALFPGPQQAPDTCAIRCQEFILEQFTGVHVDEQTLVHEAMQHGWYTPGAGTVLPDVGKLLELHGIAVHRYTHANVFHLAN